MDDIKERIKEKKYQNWVKSTLGLNQTKKALQEFVEQKFILYTNGTATLRPNQVPLTAQEVTHMQGTEYIRHSLKTAVHYTGSKWEWNLKNYNCRDCETAFEKILSLHRKGKGYKNIHWENSDNTTQISLEWAIAKVFMPQGNQDNKGPNDTDPAAMFHLMQMCTLFLNYNRGKRFEKLTKARNTLFHSPDNLVTDQEQTDYFDLMVALLTDAANDQEVPQVTRDKITEDIKKMENLQRSDITMTVFDDLEEALRIKRAGVYYDFEKSLCENDPEKLREILKIAEQIGGDMQLLKKHLHDLKNIDKYKSEIDELRKQRDSIKAVVEKIPSTVKDIEENNRKLKHDVNLMKTELHADVTLMKTDFERRADDVQKRILDQLKHVPSNEKMKRLRNTATEMAADVNELKETVQRFTNLFDGFETVRVEIGQWQRALWVEISQLESEGVVVVIIVTIVMSLLLRILLFVD